MKRPAYQRHRYTHRDDAGMLWRFKGNRPISALADAITEGAPMPPGVNSGYVCKAHAPRPNPVYRSMALHVFQRGSFCKLCFTTGKGAEHMWVQVQGTSDQEGQELFGLLDNDPIQTPDLKRGDGVHFNRSEIEDFRPPIPNKK